MSRTTRALPDSSGFTMIEVLVAVFVLSLGLLGLAMLQVESMKHNTDAYLRTQATMLAQDIIDRMRANAAAANNGAYEADAKPGTERCGESGGCSGSDGIALANYDLTVWYERLEDVLPAGSTPSSIVSEDNVHTITVRWAEREIQKQREWRVELCDDARCN